MKTLLTAGVRVFCPDINCGLTTLINYEVPESENGQEQKRVFLDQVNAILKTGTPVAILNRSTMHYLTITGIDGENLTVLNSSGLVKEPVHIDDLLSRKNRGNVVEITWFTGFRTPNEEMSEQPNLRYSEKDGYSLAQNTLENAVNIMWKRAL